MEQRSVIALQKDPWPREWIFQAENVLRQHGELEPQIKYLDRIETLMCT